MVENVSENNLIYNGTNLLWTDATRATVRKWAIGEAKAEEPIVDPTLAFLPIPESSGGQTTSTSTSTTTTSSTSGGSTSASKTRHWSDYVMNNKGEAWINQVESQALSASEVNFIDVIEHYKDEPTPTEIAQPLEEFFQAFKLFDSTETIWNGASLQLAHVALLANQRPTHLTIDLV